MLAACLPLGPIFTSKLTFWFSCKDLKPPPANFRKMREQILAAVIRLDETKTFRIVEPLYGARRHFGGYRPDSARRCAC